MGSAQRQTLTDLLWAKLPSKKSTAGKHQTQNHASLRARISTEGTGQLSPHHDASRGHLLCFGKGKQGRSIPGSYLSPPWSGR